MGAYKHPISNELRLGNLKEGNTFQTSSLPHGWNYQDILEGKWRLMWLLMQTVEVLLDLPGMTLRRKGQKSCTDKIMMTYSGAMATRTSKLINTRRTILELELLVFMS